MTIPGAVSGWVALSQALRQAARSPISSRAAIGYARDGYAVARSSPRSGLRAIPILGDVPGFAEHFLPRGRAPSAGEIFALAGDGSDAASRSPLTQGEAFYRGELAQTMVAHCARQRRRAHAWPTSPQHTIDWVTPIDIDYRGVTVHEIPPNGQGIAALMALGILRELRSGAAPPSIRPRCSTCRSRR